MSEHNQFALYKTDDWKIKVDVLFENENLWLTQKKMSELFECWIDNISLHLKNIFKDWELQEKWTIEEYSIVQKEWEREVKRKNKMYSLEAIISVWYRVNSTRWWEFRIWATNVLKDYILKWFSIDKDRFINGSKFDARYFDFLMEEIREIRASERMSYQKITDIYTTSIDYSNNSLETAKFFSKVQNKLHFAITWNTAAEIIHTRVWAEKDNCWLTNWRKAPEWKIMKSDVKVAKNYLEQKELKTLNHIVDMYLDFAEFQASKWKLMYMKDWAIKLDAFLQFNEEEILQWNWKVSKEIAIALAEKEYDKYKVIQDKNYISDFDREVKELLKGK